MLIDASDIISKSLQIYKSNFKKLLPYFSLVLVPTFFLIILTLVVDLLVGLAPLSAGLNEALFIIMAVLVGCMFFWVYTAFTKALGDLVTTNTLPPIKAALGGTIPVLWPLFYTSFIIVFAILGGFLLAIIPGFIFLVWYYFTSYAVIFHQKTGLGAMRESKRLVAGRWWGVAFRLFIPYFIFFLITMLINGLIMPFVALPILFVTSDTDVMNLIVSVLSSLFSILLMPFSFLPSLILYYNLLDNPAPTTPAAPLPPPAPTHL